MSIFDTLKSFYGTTPEATADTNGGVESMPIQIVRYAISLLYSPKLTETFQHAFRQAVENTPGVEQENSLASCYLEVERALLEHEPVRKFTRETLRRHICQHFNLDYNAEGLALLFIDPVKQEVKLALLFRNSLLERM